MEQSSPDPFQQPQQRKRKRRANSNLRQPSPSDYPLEDTGALENIFASYPQTLSTVPRPEGMRGLNEPSWALQFDHDIHLSNDYPVPNGQPTRVRGPIPGPEPIPYPSQPSDATEEQHNTQSPRAKFKSALQLVTDVIGTERRLTRESLEAAERVRQWREQWGYSSLSPGQSISPPPYSPPRKAQHTNTRLLSSPRDIELQDQTLDSSPEPTQIPNPPIPGTAAPSVDVLFKEVNSFAKAHGFGIVKYNGYTYKGRKIRYSFQCDRYGEPQPSKGAQIRP
ncbi:hypothetical protein BFJ63_vAg4922, partial [Fusarium oxysporum f. sp. narcissi]